MGEFNFSDKSKLAQKVWYFFSRFMYLEMSRPTFLGGGDPGGAHLWLFWRKRNITPKFYFQTKHCTRNNK